MKKMQETNLLFNRLTFEDRISQIFCLNKAVDLKDKRYLCLWNDYLSTINGLDSNVDSTKYTGLAATFDADLINELEEKAQNFELAEKRATEQSIVLLKNDKLLPLSKERTKKIAVIGPDAISVLDGLENISDKIETIYAQGCTIDEDSKEDDVLRTEAIWAAEQADVAILAVGYNTETKNNRKENEQYTLPKAQEKLIEAVCGVGKKTILLNFTEFFVDLVKADEMCDAVFQCWNESSLVGSIAAGMIFGDYIPSGKLPTTFYKGAYENILLEESNNYMLHYGQVLYPFGFGLTYSFVEYYRIYLSKPKVKAGEDITVTVFLKNKGSYDAKEVVQVYVVDEEVSEGSSVRKLAAFKRVDLRPGEEVKVSLNIKSEYMAVIGKEGKRVVEPGRFSLYVGGGQPDDITAKLYERDCLHIGFLVE